MTLKWQLRLLFVYIFCSKLSPQNPKISAHYFESPYMFIYVSGCIHVKERNTFCPCPFILNSITRIFAFTGRMPFYVAVQKAKCMLCEYKALLVLPCHICQEVIVLNEPDHARKFYPLSQY
jgi:hypothetical protein